MGITTSMKIKEVPEGTLVDGDLNPNPHIINPNIERITGFKDTIYAYLDEETFKIVSVKTKRMVEFGVDTSKSINFNPNGGSVYLGKFYNKKQGKCYGIATLGGIINDIGTIYVSEDFKKVRMAELIDPEYIKLKQGTTIKDKIQNISMIFSISSYGILPITFILLSAALLMMSFVIK